MDERQNGSHSADELPGANGRFYRLSVHQATGMVSVQADCSIASALDLLVEYAADHKRSVDETASDVIERRLRFQPR